MHFLSVAFRPFFALGSVYGALIVAYWVGALAGATGFTMPRWGLLWHVHEMLYGFVGAAVAGFLLTAVAAFTGRAPIRGARLAALVVAWLAGRIAMASHAPGWVVAGLDLAFPVLLVTTVATELMLAGNRRNYPLIGVVTAYGGFNLGFHLALLGQGAGTPMDWLLATLHLLALLVTVIAGRIVPSFTANWLRARGAARLPASSPALERILPGLVIVTGVLAVTDVSATSTGIAALACAAAHAMRLARWRGLSTLSNPLLAVLHLAYCWLVIGYLLLGAAQWVSGVPWSAAHHALTAGVMGTMILAVMSRVALGHTGRNLRAPAPVVVAYGCITVAALLRVVSSFIDGAGRELLTGSAIAWVLGFAIYAVVYAPILLGPRVGEAH